MQRFKCLFEANRQSARAFRQLRRHGQISNFSNFAATSRRGAIPTRGLTLHASRSTRPALNQSFSIPAHRFLSNDTASPSANAPIAPPPSDEFIPTDSFAVDQYAVDTLHDIKPHVGYLHELGLDYGWGPTTLVQDALEYAYIYGGFNWGVTIVGTVVAFRIAMLKFAVDAADMGARLRATRSLTKDIDTRLKEAIYNKDAMQRQMAVMEKQAIMKAAGVKMSKIFLGILINLPVGFGTFRIMRGMASLPVPGFENGGFWWLQDLSVPDPYFILPIASAAVIYQSFRLIQQSGDMGEGQKSTQILLRWIFPGLTLLIGASFPGCLQLTMFTTAVVQSLQQWAFLQPGFRRALNMHPLPEKQKVEAPKVLNVRGRVIDTGGPAKPEALVPKMKWHMKRVAKETQEMSEKLFPSQKPAEKKGPKRR